MTSWVVLDAGVLLASVLEETLAPNAKLLLQQFNKQGYTIAAPVLFRYELVSVVRKSVARSIIPEAEAQATLQTVMDYRVTFLIDEALLNRAYSLATRLNRPTAYDSQYLALAERLGCEFWTADERLYNATQSSLGYVRWVGAFTP
jgi:predicted nucleic acid-binding protein